MLVRGIIQNMNTTSQTTVLWVLGILALLTSRAVFFFIDDPEGPNLLIVTVLAVCIYAVLFWLHTVLRAHEWYKTLSLYIVSGLCICLAVFVYVRFSDTQYVSNTDSTMSDYKNIAYRIDGQTVQLVNGRAETTLPNSSSVVKTAYFGNDLVTDLNGDGLEDRVFLITQETSGTGVFYYVVAAIRTPTGFVSSDAYYLGDRIAPQTINRSPNPRHVRVVVVNYADRRVGEPMTTQPSIGKSVYLKLGTDNMWGIVEPDFPGEAR